MAYIIKRHTNDKTIERSNMQRQDSTGSILNVLGPGSRPLHLRLHVQQMLGPLQQIFQLLQDKCIVIIAEQRMQIERRDVIAACGIVA